MEEFEKELTHLINRHSIENVADVPDFLLAGMICRMIEALGRDSDADRRQELEEGGGE